MIDDGCSEVESGHPCPHFELLLVCLPSKIQPFLSPNTRYQHCSYNGFSDAESSLSFFTSWDCLSQEPCKIYSFPLLRTFQSFFCDSSNTHCPTGACILKKSGVSFRDSSYLGTC